MTLSNTKMLRQPNQSLSTPPISGATVGATIITSTTLASLLAISSAS